MDGQPGLRNYGTMDPDDLFDVYCYVEQIDGTNNNTIANICIYKTSLILE